MGKVIPPNTGEAIKAGKNLRGLLLFTKNPLSKAFLVSTLVLFGIALTTLDQ